MKWHKFSEVKPEDGQSIIVWALPDRYYLGQYYVAAASMPFLCIVDNWYSLSKKIGRADTSRPLFWRKVPTFPFEIMEE